MANKTYYEHIISDEMSARLTAILINDSILKKLEDKYTKQARFGQILQSMKTAKEIDQRKCFLTDELIKQETIKNERSRSFADYLDNEEAEKYNCLRDAINILCDAMETAYMDLRDLTKKSTGDMVKLEFPECFQQSLKETKEWLASEFKVMGQEAKMQLADDSDELLEEVIERVKTRRKKLREAAMLKARKIKR